MELHECRPYRIDRLVDIFDLHVKHVQFYMLRYRYTERDYYHRRLRWTSSSMLLFALWTAAHWMIIGMFIGLFLKLLPGYHSLFVIVDNILTIRGADVVQMLIVLNFVVLEAQSCHSLYLALDYRYQKLEVVFEYRRQLDKQLPGWQRTMLMRYFRRWSTFAGVLLKISVAGVAALVAAELYALTVGHLGGRLSGRELLTGYTMFILNGLYCVYALHVLIVLLAHLFTLVRIFRLRIDDVGRLVNALERRKGPGWRRTMALVRRRYADIYRHVMMYNSTIRIYVYYLGLICDCTCAVCLILYTKQDLPIRPFTLAKGSFFLNVWLYFEFVLFKLSYFSDRNLLLYKRIGAMLTQKELGSDSFRVKVHHFVQSLPNDGFGFTCGQNYSITKIEFINSLWKFLCLLTLFYEWLTVII